MSLPSFPLAVPCPGAPFTPRGPFGSVPPLRRYYDALRRPDAPLSLRLRSRLAVASLRRSTRDLPSSSATLATRAPALRPRRNLGSRPPGTTSLRLAPSVLPSEPTVSSASATCTFRGPIPQPACSLSTLRGPGCPHRHARLASGWWPCPRRAGIQPAGSRNQVSARVGVTWRPPGRGFLGAQ